MTREYRRAGVGAMLLLALPLAAQVTRVNPQAGGLVVRRPVIGLPQLPPYFQVEASAVNDPRGMAFTVTVTAESGAGQPLTNFTGTVSFNSTDSSALFSNAGPVNSYQYPFTSCASGCDNGTHTFTVLIPSARIGDVITVSGPNGMTGRTNPLGAATPVNDTLLVAAMNPGQPVVLGSGFAVAVTAETPAGVEDRGYTGTVRIASPTDSKAAAADGTPLASYSYTFTSDVGQQGVGGYQGMNPNDGRAVLTIIPGAVGEQSYTITDAASGSNGSVTVEVVPAQVAAPVASLWRFVSEYQPNGPTVPAQYGEVAMAYDGGTHRLVLVGEASASPLIWLSGNDGVSWTAAAGCAGPGLAGASLAWDEAEGKIVLFGGADYSSGRPQQQMWVSDPRDCFQELSGYGASPPARTYASLAWDPATKTLVLFGGSGSRGGIWSWDGSRWTRHAAAGAAPATRQAAMLAWDAHSRKLLLFGGWDGQANDFNDTWELDTSGWTWQRLTPAHVPPARHDALLAWDAGYQGDILFGGGAGPLFSPQGTVARQQFNDTWLWNGSDWEPLQASDIAQNATGQPAQRNGAGMAWDSQSGAMVLEGGVEMLAPPAQENGIAVQGESCGGCITSPGPPQSYANSGTGAPGTNLSLATVETELVDTWKLPSPAQPGGQMVAVNRGVSRAGGMAAAPPPRSAPAAHAAAFPAAAARPLPRPVFVAPQFGAGGALASAALTAQPGAYQGVCPVTIHLVATIGLNRAGVVFYRLQRGNQPPGAIFRLGFQGAGRQTAADSWEIQRPGVYWARIAVTSPNVVYSNVVRIQVACR